MGAAVKTEFEFLDFYHERVEVGLRGQADLPYAELDKAKKALESVYAAIQSARAAMDTTPANYDPKESETRHRTRDYYRERVKELEAQVKQVPLARRRAGVLAQLSAMVHEGWEIVSCHGSDQVSIGMHSGYSEHNILILLRRNVGE